MKSQQYPRPPIVEAIIELRFVGTLAERELQRLRDRFKAQYPAIEENTSIEVQVDGKKVNHSASLASFKLTAPNAQDVVLFQKNTAATSRLAPYCGWDHFQSQAELNYETFLKVVGRQQIVRLGVRFINRIDFPNGLIVNNDFREYLEFGVRVPPTLKASPGPFFLSVDLVEASTEAHVKLQTGVLSPFLLDHTSVLLDIDASFEGEIPLKTSDMWDMVARLRTAKNAVFEAAITDKMRMLFQ